MNAKTSKLIHRAAVTTGVKERDLKRQWRNTPKPKRNAIRKMFKQAIE